MAIPNLSPAEITRYSRQMALEGWGPEAQERVKSSRVLIAGAGGLGSAAALYLTASGVGAIRLVDDSRVALEDLSHQVLYREQDLGKAKAAVAESRLQGGNSFTLVNALVRTLSPHNVCRLASGCQVLLDATNDFTVSLVLQQAAVKLGLPLVRAWVWGLEGGIATYWPGRSACLVCSDTKSPKSTGRPPLLGPLPGILGALQALETLRILGGLGGALLGRVLFFDGAGFHFTEKSLRPGARCPICRDPLQSRQVSEKFQRLSDSR